MEELGRSSEVADLHVVLRTELEIAFGPGGRVLGSLAFITVWEIHDEAGTLSPLGFAAGDELVDNDLGAVGKVAELGFPDDEEFWIVLGITEIKAKDAGFGEAGVVDAKLGLVFGQVQEGAVALACVDIIKCGVAVAKGASFTVLSGDSDRGTVHKEGAVGKLLTETPVNSFAGGVSFVLLVELAFDLGVEAEVVRDGDEGLGNVVEFVLGDSGTEVLESVGKDVSAAGLASFDGDGFALLGFLFMEDVV